MKILLVQPAPFEPGRLGLENVIWLSEPVALTSIAAMVSPKHEVRILDMRLEGDLALNEMLLQFRPNLVGTTSMTTDCYQAKAILETAKSTLGPDCFTFVGGHHPTLAPEDFEDEVVDSLCMGEGEETFEELVEHLASGGDARDLHHINGLRFRQKTGAYHTTAKRHQNRHIDTFPPAARHLLPEKYRGQYFYTVASPMASMATSRGCSYDCNFCAIWEFYERKTRFMSAKAICDRLETMEEKFVFLLDDNFLTHRGRLEELCAEIEKRGIKKFFLTQGRSDFIADNPDLMLRLRNCGLLMVLSGYESNDDDALAALRKSNTFDKNKLAAKMLQELGIISTGIFMVRPDFEIADFDRLYDTINEMEIALPLVTILTPLPGTQLWKAKKDELLTRDARLFDLLHCVLPTKIPREQFYEKLSEAGKATEKSTIRGILGVLRRRPGLTIQSMGGIIRFARRLRNYRPVARNADSRLRDEIGLIPPHITMANAPKRRIEIPMTEASA